MNFSYILANPLQLNTEDISYLEELSEKYPFCQLNYMLLAKSYADNKKDDQANTILKKAAIHALSRNVLRKFLSGETPTLPLNGELPFTRKYKDIPVPVSTEIDPVQALRGLDYSEVLLQNEEDGSQNKNTILDKQLEQINLIDRFIEAEKSIGPMRAKLGTLLDEENPDLSEERLELEDSPVTEVYAKVLARQGKVTRAIEVYEKLSLKFPEKKALFVAKIEEIKNKK